MFHRAGSSVLAYFSAFRFGRLLFLLLLLAAGSVWAQPSTGGPMPNPAAVPLDGGASLLLATGVAYGLKRLRRAKR